MQQSPPANDAEANTTVASEEENEDERASSKTPELSKRDKRRAREAKKKAEEEALKEQLKEARKVGKKGNKAKAPSPTPQSTKKNDFVKPKQKGRARGGNANTAKPVVTADDVERVVEEIQTLRKKMVDKWGEDWTRKPLVDFC